MQTLKNDPQKCRVTKLEGHKITTLNENICVPKKIQGRMSSWCHKNLAHPSTSRTEATVCQHFAWPSLSKDAHNFITTCGRQKT